MCFYLLPTDSAVGGVDGGELSEEQLEEPSAKRQRTEGWANGYFYFYLHEIYSKCCYIISQNQCKITKLLYQMFYFYPFYDHLIF